MLRQLIFLFLSLLKIEVVFVLVNVLKSFVLFLKVLFCINFSFVFIYEYCYICFTHKLCAQKYLHL